ncbi:dCMP deaminase [Rhizoctonia solani AG-1 IB]|uniref:Deoxycytidylate deaminase n=1 Tax=Thanatephorus cucumeris (strain AG1-IB / isolate 7/3/14) TaxID=1108050 RepID=A0A0B7G3Q8_THACB|nr:dCMP deaminase [Rhizoctonia solani AG-1 IB]
MLICIVGTQCSGKRAVKQYLQTIGFQEIIYNPSGPKEEEDEYNDFNKLLSYVTQNWLKDFVCTSLRDLGMLRSCAQRPFFILLSVDAPVITRWKRNTDKHPQITTSLEQFIQESDKERFGHGIPGQDSLNDILQSISHVSITNDFSEIAPLHDHLASLALTNPERTRPGWDDYFMLLASLASLRCNCMKRRVGAVLVRNKRVVSTGYNGTPRGLVNCNQGGCKRCNGTAKSGEAYDSCLCLHAEENALLEAGHDRVGENSTLYCNTCPCLRCTIKIVQSGVTEVVYNKSYSMDEASANIFKEAGVILRQHSPPRDYPI